MWVPDWSPERRIGDGASSAKVIGGADPCWEGRDRGLGVAPHPWIPAFAGKTVALLRPYEVVKMGWRRARL